MFVDRILVHRLLVAAALLTMGSGSPLHATPNGDEFVTMVSAPDGVLLWTKTYLPAVVPPEGVPTLLRRTPYRYPNAFEYQEAKARFYADRGYAYVLQDCRGRFESEGTFSPFLGEVEDGVATTEWIVEQPWSNGRVGTMGSSYDGFTALAAAVDNPAVVAVVADDTTIDMSSFLRRGGQVYLWESVGWLHYLDHQAWPSDAGMAALANVLHLETLDQIVLGRVDSFWQAFTAASDPADPFFATRRLPIGNLCAPVLSIKSAQVPWNGPDEVWAELVANGCAAHRDDHRLVITPDPHGYHSNQVFDASTAIARLILDCIDVWLGQRPVDLDPYPVWFATPTDSVYRRAASWPAGTDEHVLFLTETTDGLGGLEPDAAAVRSGVDLLSVDPATADPCTPAYPRLYFATEPLAEPFVLAGPASLGLRATISTPDADFTVVLYDWTGTELVEVCDGVLRARYRDGSGHADLVTPGERIDSSIELWSRAYEFDIGHQLVIAITANRCLIDAWFVYAENPNTGEPFGAQTSRQPVQYSFIHDPADPMRLELAVLPAPCSGDADRSGTVDFGDLLLVIAGWGPCPPECMGDVTGDGIVNLSDLLMVIGNWGSCRNS